MRALLLAAALVLTTAACSPAATPSPATTWDYYENAPGGIAVTGPRAEGDMLGAQTDAEACRSLGFSEFPPGFCESVTRQGSSPNGNAGGECQSGSAFEIFPPGWASGQWIRRCR